MSLHHKLSPSGASRWLTCTASPAFEAHIQEAESFHAAEGTHAHTLAAEILTLWRGGQPSGAADVCRQYLKTDPYWARPVLEYVDFVRSIPGNLYVEVKCSLDPWITGGFGTADAVTWHEATRTLFVTDLKFGRGIRVYAQGNPQLRLYALGASHTLGIVPDDVVMTIHQPRLDHVAQETLTFAALAEWGQTIVKPAVVEISDGGSYRPSESACQWCRGRAVCAARAAANLAFALESFK